MNLTDEKPGQMTLSIPCFNCGKTVTRELDIYDSGIDWELSSILLEINYHEHNGKYICGVCVNRI